MTKLEEIGVTAMTGMVVYSLSLFFFGLANRSRSTHIAPRAEARPRNVIYNPNPTDPIQDRGNAWFGWIAWVLKLSYEDMLLGVPGTGTKEGGLAGRNLTVNLDNIVMLRFHSFGLRVTTLGLFVYVLVLLPLNWTAGCGGDDYELTSHCGNMTNYSKTTLANITPNAEIGTDLIGLSGRLYVVVFCSWFMTWYACYELRQEWVDILAMRRFYFLEMDHWKRRQDEMKHILAPQVEDSRSPPQRGLQRARKVPEVDEPDYLRHREPWIPNPEAPDTPPSIALYSVLVGGIPSRPPGEDDPDPESEEDARDLNRMNLDWQLSVTSAFFDHCVPNQPGFSSSVAAVTILPKASEIASAWKKWFQAAAKLRRLRFIRKQIRERRHYDIEGEEEDLEQGQRKTAETAPPSKFSQFTSSRSIYNDDLATDKTDYNREVLGSALDEEVEELFLEALEFGPEQAAVYSREFAQSAAPCCPNGCYEGALMDATIDDLLDMEEVALEEVQAANQALQVAQSKAVTNARSKENDPTKEHAKSKENSPKRDSDLSMHTPSKSTRGSLYSALPLDLSAIKKTLGNDTVQNLLQNDRMKNLMGKDSSVPNSLSRKSGHRKTGSMDSINLFDVEGKLWGEKNPSQAHSLNVSSSHNKTIKKPSPIKNPSKSAPMPDHDSFPRPDTENVTRGRANTEVDKFGVPMSFGNRSKVWDEQRNAFLDTSNLSDVVALNSFESSDGAQSPSGMAELLSFESSDGALHPLKRDPLRAREPVRFENSEGALHPLKCDPLRASEPVMHAKADPDVSPTRSQPIRSHSTDGISLDLEAHLSPMETDFVSPSSTARQRRGDFTSPKDAWALVDTIAHDGQEQGALQNDEFGGRQFLSTGNWDVSSLTDFLMIPITTVRKLFKWTTARSNQAVDLVAGDSTYAVVTFTSRQAAVAARKCLADGRASDRWVQIDTLPIPPLADAAPCDLLSCRGCCRPVTLTVNDRQKKWRFYVSLACLGLIYFFYTIPLTMAAAFADSDNLTELFPKLQDLKQENNSIISAELLSSLIAALVWALFFAFCPMMFKMIANFGSNATSIAEAEYQALKYFWWFMVVSAFSGSSLQRVVLDGFNSGISVGSEFQSILRSIAATIPTVISASWINWIIVKYSITLPLQYLLQMNTFIFSFFGLKCCVRAVRGGGPGGPVPFRIYVDSGMVLLCLFSLAPASPLVAPFSFLYFLISTPMLRRNVIYMYRPKFDGGGIRWPFIFDMIVSSLFVSQILLSTMMALKKSFGPAFLAAVPFVPTLLFRDAMRHRFLRSFSDVALLQTSLLDGWDTTAPTSMDKREGFRRFLVDSHKAAYVPVCIAGTNTDEVLTAEPAVIVPTMEENQLSNASAAPTPQAQPEAPPMTPGPYSLPVRETSNEATPSLRSRNPRNQFATMRRTSTVFVPRGNSDRYPQNRSGRFSSLDLSVISDESSPFNEKEK